VTGAMQARGSGRPNRLLIVDYADGKAIFRVETDIDVGDTSGTTFKDLRKYLDKKQDDNALAVLLPLVSNKHGTKAQKAAKKVVCASFEPNTMPDDCK